MTRPEWRADRDDSPAGKIVLSLDRPTLAPPKVLLSGTIGIGKSTELYRVAEARGFRLRTLHNAPVLDHTDPRLPGPGVRFLGEVFRRRVRDLGAEDIVPPPLLDKLAYYSGGRLRDFIRSIGMLAERGWDDDAGAATAAHVDDVIKEARQLVETGLDRGHIAVLEEVARDRDHRLPRGDRAHALLMFGRLLPYANGPGWFYPHPLLTRSLVRT